jgi:hypothetical protein
MYFDDIYIYVDSAFKIRKKPPKEKTKKKAKTKDI